MLTQLSKSVPGFPTQVHLISKLGPWTPSTGEGTGVGMQGEREGRQELSFLPGPGCGAVGCSAAHQPWAPQEGTLRFTQLWVGLASGPMGILERAQVLPCEGAGLRAGRRLQGQTSVPRSVLPAASGAMGADQREAMPHRPDRSPLLCSLPGPLTPPQYP